MKALLAALLMTSTAWAAPESEAQLKTFLDGLDAKLEAIDTARQLEFYYQLRGLPASNLQRYQDLHREFFSDKDAAKTLETWQTKTTDPTLLRRIELYRDVYLDFMYDTFRLASADSATVSTFTALQVQLNAEITAFRPTYGGDRVGRAVVSNALRNEPDRAKRREAFLSSREISQRVAPRMVELLQATDAMYKQMGFSGTVEGRLRGSGLTRETVESLFSRLETETNSEFQTMLGMIRRDLKVDKVEPWDIAYWIEKQAGFPSELFKRESAMPRLLGVARGLGFKPEELLITVEHANLANRGWNVPIRMGVEARLVLSPLEGKIYYDTLFHEYGHALHETLIKQDVGTFRTDRPGPFAEGMAEVLAQFVRDPRWQAQELKMSPEMIKRGADAERWRRILEVRKILFLCMFQYEALTHPEADHAGTYAKLYKRYYFIDQPEDPAWADDMFLVQPQVYMQNYLIAALIASQVHRAMRREIGPELFGNPKVAAFLTDHFYKHGAAKDWKDMVREATGAPLGVDAHLADLSIKR
ncbi:MAG: hypothetical protein HY078_14040 [Elusimicrobia bacterium]|nr:hypothetical protein [Elusimicrobiota bacterium]